MIRIILPFICVIALVSLGMAQKPGLENGLQSLVDAERAFARTAAEKGVRDSFLAFIANDGILYRPGPVNGKEWLSARPARPGLLTWQPVYADISSAGDLGFTTGPWEFREKGIDDPPVGFGEFSTVWKRQPDGTWKFVIDIGIGHDKPASAAVPWQLPADFTRSKIASVSNLPGLKNSLMGIDKDFSKDSVAKGADKAYAEFGGDQIRLLRNGSFPIIGRKDVTTFIASKRGTLSWEPVFADISSSGDLGYTYGNYEFKGGEANASTESGFYMRVWKKQSGGQWRLVLDVFNEKPKPQAS